MNAFLILLVVPVVFIYGQQCDFGVFEQCLRSSLPQPPQGAGKPEDMKAKADKCFTDAGCSTPKPPQGGRGDDSCQKKIFEGIKNDLQSCVQQKVPGVELPQIPGGGPGGDDHGMGGGPPPPGGPNGGNPLDGMVNAFCKTDAAKASAKQCLQTLMPVGGQRPDFDAINKQMCQAKQNCLKKLTPQCQQQFKQVKDAACKCAKEKIAPKASQIEASFKACGGGPPQGGPQGGSPQGGTQGGPSQGGPQGGPPQGGQGGPRVGQQGGSPIDKLQQMFCNKDEC